MAIAAIITKRRTPTKDFAVAIGWDDLVRLPQSFRRLGAMPTAAVGMWKRNSSGKNFMDDVLEARNETSSDGICFMAALFAVGGRDFWVGKQPPMAVAKRRAIIP
jgi:hypothetical protein